MPLPISQPRGHLYSLDFFAQRRQTIRSGSESGCRSYTMFGMTQGPVKGKARNVECHLKTLVYFLHCIYERRVMLKNRASWKVAFFKMPCGLQLARGLDILPGNPRMICEANAPCVLAYDSDVHPTKSLRFPQNCGKNVQPEMPQPFLYTPSKRYLQFWEANIQPICQNM